jgi:hypothetical protein
LITFLCDLLNGSCVLTVGAKIIEDFVKFFFFGKIIEDTTGIGTIGVGTTGEIASISSNGCAAFLIFFEGRTTCSGWLSLSSSITSSIISSSIGLFVAIVSFGCFFKAGAVKRGRPGPLFSVSTGIFKATGYFLFDATSHLLFLIDGHNNEYVYIQFDHYSQMHVQSHYL